MELTACRNLRGRITQLEARLKLWREASPARSRLEACRQSTPTESTPERLTRLICDGERELANLRGALEETAAALAAEIFTRVTDPRAAGVLFLRYVACLPFDEIARQAGYSIGHVFKLHRAGCKNFWAGAQAQTAS